MAKYNPTVFVVTAVYNRLPQTKTLLKSLSKQTYKKYRVYITDDGSTDGTEEFLKKNYPEIEIIKGDGNLWWTAGLNRAISKALLKSKKSDFVLTINNDCILQANFLQSMLDLAQKNSNSLIGSIEVDIDDKKTIHSGVISLDWWRGKLFGSSPNKLNELPKTEVGETAMLQTKGTIFQISVFRRIGLFNEILLPHYMSDYEFSIRAKNAGFKLLVSYKNFVFSDHKTTGITNLDESSLSFTEFRRLLLSRRSQLNILDHFQFVRSICPWYLKPLNYCLIICRFFYYLTRLKFLYFLNPIMVSLKRGLLRQ